MVNGTVNIDPGLKGKLSATGSIKGKVAAAPVLKGKLSIPERYIPSNYGLITWDGSVMTVS